MVEKQFADLPPEFRSEIKIGKAVYEMAPSPGCPNGVRGRAPVMEVMEVTPEMEGVILKDPTEQAMWKVARANGMLTMKEDALLKAFERLIPFEEVNTL